MSKLHFDKLINQYFDTDGKNAGRTHKDEDNLQQVIYQILAAYFEDDCADELTSDPIMTAILSKESLASQPTLSRFYNRLDDYTLQQLNTLMHEMRKVVYSIKRPERVLLDLDSTLLDTYGKQEGEGFNFHYSAHGYHPLVCYDGFNGDLLGIELRDGTTYSSKGVADFLRPILEDLTKAHYAPHLSLRGDSGFATPELYEICEEPNYDVKYAIRLKFNSTLMSLGRIRSKSLQIMSLAGKFFQNERQHIYRFINQLIHMPNILLRKKILFVHLLGILFTKSRYRFMSINIG
jgi:hypothetical protein